MVSLHLVPVTHRSAPLARAHSLRGLPWAAGGGGWLHPSIVRCPLGLCFNPGRPGARTQDRQGPSTWLQNGQTAGTDTQRSRRWVTDGAACEEMPSVVKGTQS